MHAGDRGQAEGAARARGRSRRFARRDGVRRQRRQRHRVSARRRPARRSRGCVAGGQAARAMGPLPLGRRRLRPGVLRQRVGSSARMTDLFSLEGRVAVVTGGAGQVGVEIVRGLEEQGARVAVFDLAVERFEVDVTDREAIVRATDEVVQEMGVPHVLVNAAALDSPPDAPAEEAGPFESYPEQSFDQVMNVNVKGTFLASQVIGARMAAQGRGSIINVSSVYGMLSPVQELYDFRRKGGEEFFKPVAYSVSKSALYNLTRYLPTYWAKSGVRVDPLTLAGVWNDQPQDFLDAYTERMPIGRMADVREVVGPVVFLASDASSYVTGANLVADGGWSAW